MGTFYESNGWRARVTIDGKVSSRRFKTKEDGDAWCLAIKQAAKSLKTQRNGSVDAAFDAAALQDKSVAAVCRMALDLDWPDSETGKERGIRTARMLGLERPIIEITTEDLDRMVADLRREDYQAATILIYISAANVMLKRARRMKWINEMPLLPERRTLRVNEPRSLVIESEWFERLLIYFESDREKLLTQFLWHVGCRAGEALNLPWERINFSEKRVSFIKTKTLMPRTLPMSSDVEQILLRARKLSGSNDCPFPRDYYSFREEYKKAVRYVCRELGLSEQIEKEWVIHTLRHTCLTRLANRGATAAQIQQWAGHRSLKVSQGYVHGSGIDLESLVSHNTVSISK
jgi:integrase